MNLAQISLIVLLFVLLAGARFFPNLIARLWRNRKSKK